MTPYPVQIDLVEYARAFIGTPYIYGGDNPIIGFDCSGLVSEVHRAFGLIGYRDRFTSQYFYEKYAAKFIPRTQGHIQRNDILFFGREGKVKHVAIAYNSDNMIEAGGGDEYTIDTSAAGKNDAFVRIRPISNRVDFYAAFPTGGKL